MANRCTCFCIIHKCVIVSTVNKNIMCVSIYTMRWERKAFHGKSSFPFRHMKIAYKKKEVSREKRYQFPRTPRNHLIITRKGFFPPSNCCSSRQRNDTEDFFPRVGSSCAKNKRNHATDVRGDYNSH